MYCWGSNIYGQSGQPSGDKFLTPQLVSGISNVTQISVHNRHSCALSDGKVFCWGSNEVGRLGDGTTTDSSSPVSIASNKTFTQVSVGFEHSCAITDEEELYCWGNSNTGEFGADPVSVPADNVPFKTNLVGVKKVEAGRGSTCVVLAVGTVACTGDNSRGQLGIGNTQNQNSPVQVGNNIDWTQISSKGNFFRISFL